MAEKLKKQRFALTAKRFAPDSPEGGEIYLLQALLARYGYLSGAYLPGKYDEHTRRAVSLFQNFYRIYPKETGIVDEATINLLNHPRCGVPDPHPGQRTADGRLAPYVAVGAKWQQNLLQYKFLNATPDISDHRQREIIREAFSRWSQICGLRFEEAEDLMEPELSIGFHRGSHGDGYPFDDSGGADGNTLAHAFFPPPDGGEWAGSLHFDEFETWKDQPGGEGTRLYNVALHEIGHLLGLGHSQDQNAIMYAYYAEDRNDLQADDIAGVQSLYGSSVEQPVAIAPGQVVSGHLPQQDAEVRYQITFQNKLLIKLDGPDGQDFDIYIRHGAPPGNQQGEYDFASIGSSADELITIDDPQPGTYHVLVHSYRGSGSFDVEVAIS